MKYHRMNIVRQRGERLVFGLDNSDVMRALNISQRTLQTLRSNGTLPYSQIGGKLYYRRADIETLLDRNYVATKEKGGKR